jgi:hypothetical protein
MPKIAYTYCLTVSSVGRNDGLTNLLSASPTWTIGYDDAASVQTLTGEIEATANFPPEISWHLNSVSTRRVTS